MPIRVLIKREPPKAVLREFTAVHVETQERSHTQLYSSRTETRETTRSPSQWKERRN